MADETKRILDGHEIASLYQTGVITKEEARAMVAAGFDVSLNA